jgi:hypothetical protein
VITKTISVALLLYPGLGLALSESEQWQGFTVNDIMSPLANFVVVEVWRISVVV